MSIVRTIICDICATEFTEQAPAGRPQDGFPGWGHVFGLVNNETKSSETTLCPKCLQKVGQLLSEISGGDD